MEIINHPCSPNTQMAEARELEFQVSLACISKPFPKRERKQWLGCEEAWELWSGQSVLPQVSCVLISCSWELWSGHLGFAPGQLCLDLLF